MTKQFVNKGMERKSKATQKKRLHRNTPDHGQKHMLSRLDEGDTLSSRLEIETSI